MKRGVLDLGWFRHCVAVVLIWSLVDDIAPALRATWVPKKMENEMETGTI